MPRIVRWLTSFVVGAAVAFAPIGIGVAQADPPAEESECVRTGAGRRIVCTGGTIADGHGTNVNVCTYDDVLGVFGWGTANELVCVATNEHRGYLGTAPGACERTLGIEKPHACVNGREGCLVWVLSVRVLCHL